MRFSIRDFFSKRKENKSNKKNKLVKSSDNNIESTENNNQSEINLKDTKKGSKVRIKVKDNTAPVTVVNNITNNYLIPAEVTEWILSNKDSGFKQMLDNEYKTPLEKLKTVKDQASSVNKMPELTSKIMSDEIKDDDKV